ncbi:hypothetical protein QBC34DRAFT_386967 [Podospora aff. communis PSN243]|uniref:Chitin-binding type-1 domain-containing protein n=1 Tax=Podospora aff. communis PSN243 TaxID=3040156 RepID=A0AAV9G5S8_9PEZI|nr:hypothetical protein QBC34DRAFT_386967 [Podospora aff. communis PSN243]
MRFTLALLATSLSLVLASPVAPVGALEAREDASLVEARQIGRCPCAPGLCCSQWGYCGTGPEYCGTNSTRVAVREPVAVETALPVAEGPTLEHRQLGACPCARGLCCSQWGYCGTGPEYCGGQSTKLPLAAREPVAVQTAVPVAEGPTLEHRQLGACPCARGLCCSQWGYCGTGPEYCGGQSTKLPFAGREAAAVETAVPVA